MQREGDKSKEKKKVDGENSFKKIKVRDKNMKKHNYRTRENKSRAILNC